MCNISKHKREECYKRDNYKCVKCGSPKKLTVDHVIPKTLPGGVNRLYNLQTMCSSCNGKKGRSVVCYTRYKKTLKNLRDWGYKLNNVLRKPEYV